MAVRFSSLENLFDSCKKHLDATGSHGTDVESYFVQHILVRICAEYEIRIQQLIEKRGIRSNDEPTRNFVKSCLRQVCKDFNVGDIGGILARFSKEYRDEFSKEIVSKEPNVAWDNIYNNRVTVAHKIGSVNFTLPELEAEFRKSLKVFDELIKALGLKPGELKGLR